MEPAELRQGFVSFELDEACDFAIVEKDFYKYPNQTLEVSVDGLTFTVEGEMPMDATLSVEPMDMGGYAAKVKEETGNILSSLYDVSIYDSDGEVWEPVNSGRKVRLTVTGLDSVHEGLTSMIHIAEGGEIKTVTPAVDTLYSTNTVTCETDTFSPYGTTDITATTSMTKIDNINISHIVSGETNHSIYKMALTYNSTTADAFCLDLGKAARFGKDYVQDGAFNTKNVLKILTVYDVGGYLDYVQAQVLVWAAQKGVTDRTAVLKDLDGDHAMTDTQITNALAAIDAVSSTSTYYTWKESEDPTTYQRFLTRIGKAIDFTPPSPSTDESVSDMWQIGDNAYAYCVMDKTKNLPYGEGTLHITGYGDTWNATNMNKWTDQDAGAQYGGGFNTPVGDYIPWTQERFEYTSGVNTYNAPYSGYIYNIVFDPDSNITGIGSYLFKEISYKNHDVTIENMPWDTVTFYGTASVYQCGFTETDVTINNARYIGTNALYFKASGDSGYGNHIKHITFSGEGTVFSVRVLGFFGSGAYWTHPDVGGEIRVDFNVKNAEYGRNGSLGPVIGEMTGCSGNSEGGYELVIGSDVNVIPDYMFYHANFIKDITFESGSTLKTIGGWAFNEALFGNETIVFPASLESVGDYSFQRTCIGYQYYNYETNNYFRRGYLKNIHVEDGSQLKTIGYYAFSHGNMDNEEIDTNVVSGIESVDFDKMTSLEEIKSGAFMGHMLIKDIYLPSSVTTIHNGAFKVKARSAFGEVPWYDVDTDSDGTKDKEITYLSPAHKSSSLADFTGINNVVRSHSWDYEGRYIGETKYAITFDSDNGDPVETAFVSPGAAIGSEIPSDPEKEHFVFSGWYSGGVYYEKSSISSLVPNDDMAFVAHWTAKPIHKLTFNSNGGGTPPDPIEFDEDDLPITMPGQESMVIDGMDPGSYEFLGWSTTQQDIDGDAHYVGYREGDPYNQTPFSSYAGETVIYAVWERVIDFTVVLPMSVKLEPNGDKYDKSVPITLNAGYMPFRLAIQGKVTGDLVHGDDASITAPVCIDVNPSSVPTGDRLYCKSNHMNNDKAAEIQTVSHAEPASVDYEFVFSSDLKKGGSYSNDTAVTFKIFRTS